MGNGTIDGLDASRQTALAREFDDPCPDRWNQAQGDGDHTGNGREPAKDGFEQCRQQRQQAETHDHQPPEDSCTIERQVVRQDATQFLRRGAGRRERNEPVHVDLLFNPTARVRKKAVKDR